MTSEDWKRAEHILRTIGRVVLNCDGYQLTIEEGRYRNRIVLGWYSNGVFEGRWFNSDCEERRRFARPVSRYLYSKKHRDELKKLIRGQKRFAKEHGLDPEAKYQSFSNIWPSFQPFKRHLIKANQSITLVEA
jgi:hypothetical protein